MTIRCDYCGKFISHEDIDKGLAMCEFSQEWDWFQEDVSECIKSECKRCLTQDTVQSPPSPPPTHK